MALLLDSSVSRRAAGQRMRVVARAARVAWGCGLLAALVSAWGLPAVSAAAAPALPAWVKPGLVVQYAEDLGGYVDYDYTDTVAAVSHGVVEVRTYTWSPGLVGTGKHASWSCPAVCTGLPAATSAQFWVDPSTPVRSLSGGPWSYQYMGVVAFTLQGKAWKAGLLYHATSHGPVVTYFQAKTGLVLYHKEYAYSIPYHTWYTIQLSYQG